MKIVLYSGKNDETVLCDGVTRQLDRSAGPTGFRCPLQFAVQPANYVRAGSQTFFPRGQGACTISFSVTRRCSTNAAALAWLLAHLRDCKTSGTLKFIVGTTVYTVPNVSLVSVDNQPPLDATVRLTYTLNGGRLA
jgi:hypothetical protein